MVQYRPVNELKWAETYSISPEIDGLELGNASLVCEDLQLHVSAVSLHKGIEGFSLPVVVGGARPPVSAKMQLKSIVYEDTPFVTENYRSNGTLVVTLEWELKGAWVLGEADLVVETLFHMLTCAEQDLSQAIPMPEFVSP